ncbi:MAG: hypothetical protein SWL02_09770 [Pseudomonadota bacterium]|nr:hypothetical protein [Pseudomonadota bacterium]
MTLKYQPLSDLEVFDLLRAAYPEKFTDDSDETWEATQEFFDQLSGYDELADFMGRVMMLAPVYEFPATKTLNHVLFKKLEGREGFCVVVARAVNDNKE